MLFIDCQVCVLEETYRGGEQYRGNQEAAPVLLLGEPTLLTRSTLRAALADCICVHIRAQVQNDMQMIDFKLFRLILIDFD